MDANSKRWILSACRVYLARRSTDKAVIQSYSRHYKFWRFASNNILLEAWNGHSFSDDEYAHIYGTYTCRKVVLCCATLRPQWNNIVKLSTLNIFCTVNLYKNIHIATLFLLNKALLSIDDMPWIFQRQTPCWYSLLPYIGRSLKLKTWQFILFFHTITVKHHHNSEEQVSASMGTPKGNSYTH